MMAIVLGLPSMIRIVASGDYPAHVRKIAVMMSVMICAPDPSITGERRVLELISTEGVAHTLCGYPPTCREGAFCLGNCRHVQSAIGIGAHAVFHGSAARAVLLCVSAGRPTISPTR